MANKLRQLQKRMAEKEIDLCLFFSSSADPNYFYFTGSKAYGILAVPKIKKPFIITNIMEMEAVENAIALPVLALSKKGELPLVIKKRIGHCKRIGINKYNILLATAESLRKQFKSRFVDIGEFCSEMRSVKNDEEIENIRKACAMTDRIFSEIITDFKFKTEDEVSDFIFNSAKKKGFELSFPSIVSSGRHSSMPHHEPKGQLKKGFCIIDMGVKYNGYCSDMTRTIYLGIPFEKEALLYNTLLKCQTEIISNAKSGIKASKLSILAKKLLNNYAMNMIHDLGHGIGIDIHEIPSMSSEIALRENMALTIEPGIYFKGKFGIRIEDSILIQKNSSEVLTKSKKKLIIIP